MEGTAAHTVMRNRKGEFFACLGDSITSEQVTGIGTKVCHRLQMELFGNFACGWATGSDWHEGEETLTVSFLGEQPNCFCAENVLSNQVLRLLKAVEERGKAPRVIYIAISGNDGAKDWCEKSPVPLMDDTTLVCSQTYEELTRRSLASALRWAVETLRKGCPGVEIFAASPLQAYTTEEEGPFSRQELLLKREIIRKICRFCGVTFVDSYYESGFTEEIAREHGEVHPDEEWAERIAEYVAGEIGRSLSKR